MKMLKSTWESVKSLTEKYPAVLSGYFLVGYSFVSIIRLFIRAKQGTLSVEDLYDVFSALPFMWLLAVTIVKIMEDRSGLRQMESALRREQHQRQSRELQLAALKEAEKVLQHNINNPLAVIALSIGHLKRGVQRDHVLLDETNDIEYASRRIGTVLTDFSRTQFREVQSDSSSATIGVTISG
jgi:signal transduction histidine kinase